MSSVPVNRYRIWRRASAFHEGPPTNGGSNTRILLNGRSARPQTTQCWAQFSAAHRKRPDRSCDRKATLRAFLRRSVRKLHNCHHFFQHNKQSRTQDKRGRTGDGNAQNGGETNSRHGALQRMARHRGHYGAGSFDLCSSIRRRCSDLSLGLLIDTASSVGSAGFLTCRCVPPVI